MHGTGKNVKRKQKPPPPLEDAKQFERFVETAKRLDVDESGKSFEMALKKIVPIRKINRQKSNDS